MEGQKKISRVLIGSVYVELSEDYKDCIDVLVKRAMLNEPVQLETVVDTKNKKLMKCNDKYLVIVLKNASKPGIYSLSTYADSISLAKKTSRFKTGSYIAVNSDEGDQPIGTFVEFIKKHGISVVKNELKSTMAIDELFEYLSLLNMDNGRPFAVSLFSKEHPVKCVGKSDVSSLSGENNVCSSGDDSAAVVQQEKPKASKRKPCSNNGISISDEPDIKKPKNIDDVAWETFDESINERGLIKKKE